MSQISRFRTETHTASFAVASNQLGGALVEAFLEDVRLAALQGRRWMAGQWTRCRDGLADWLDGVQDSLLERWGGWFNRF